MVIELLPFALGWDEVDPARHAFDEGSAAEVVHALGPARRVPKRPELPYGERALYAWSHNEGQRWADAMSYALAERYGRWVVGWRWAHDEGDFDGGPVGNWCCPLHSITTARETVDRVVAALCEWRGWLEALAGRFEAYPLELAAVEDQRILWERAAHHLILQVVDRTGCGSGWQGHCGQVLTWFLSRWGVAPGVAQRLVDQAIGGRFLSWTAPDTVLVDGVAERLALSLRPDDAMPSAAAPAVPSAAPEPGPAVDHLRRWLEVRETVPWHECPDGGGAAPVVPPRDGVAEDIRAFDGALDPDRARGLLAAVESLRADAARGAALDFELLRTWQRHVLGTPQAPPFRSLSAFAKQGRERYGIDADTRGRFDACLAQSAPDGKAPLPVTARAARAYLDVCFFHPFDDGNARSAFLTLVFVLAREGITLDTVGLLRRVAFHAGDPQDALALARYVDIHITSARDAAASAGSPDRK